MAKIKLDGSVASDPIFPTDMPDDGPMVMSTDMPVDTSEDDKAFEPEHPLPPIPKMSDETKSMLEAFSNELPSDDVSKVDTPEVPKKRQVRKLRSRRPEVITEAVVPEKDLTAFVEDDDDEEELPSVLKFSKGDSDWDDRDADLDDVDLDETLGVDLFDMLVLDTQEFHYLMLDQGAGFIKDSCPVSDANKLMSIIQSSGYVSRLPYYQLPDHVLGADVVRITEPVSRELVDDVDSRGVELNRVATYSYVVYTDSGLITFQSTEELLALIPTFESLDAWFEHVVNNSVLSNPLYEELDIPEIETFFKVSRWGTLSISDDGGFTQEEVRSVNTKYAISFERILHVLRLNQDEGCLKRFVDFYMI